jgi:hypothetical protein
MKASWPKTCIFLAIALLHLKVGPKLINNSHWFCIKSVESYFILYYMYFLLTRNVQLMIKSYVTITVWGLLNNIYFWREIWEVLCQYADNLGRNVLSLCWQVGGKCFANMLTVLGKISCQYADNLRLCIYVYFFWSILDKDCISKQHDDKSVHHVEEKRGKLQML